ncbi:unnamed protein product [Auanema sp. JU1783]|nr:unnamed protein product [Auanema sp. JU1783]
MSPQRQSGFTSECRTVRVSYGTTASMCYVLSLQPHAVDTEYFDDQRMRMNSSIIMLILISGDSENSRIMNKTLYGNERQY